MLLDRAGLRHAFDLLDAELGRMGVRADVFVVGGAAMSMAYDARRATKDVDAVFVPSAEVGLAADRIATDLGLEPGWLNDGAKAYIPGDDPRSVQVYEGEHLQVAAASPQLLLAMKLLAARVERDTDDIVALYALCGFTTADEGLRLVADAYPSYVIAPRTRFLLEELYPPHQAPTIVQDRDHGLGL